MMLTHSSPADAAARQPRRRARRLALAAAATLAAALLIPSGVTGAYWTASAPGAAGTPGIGGWCATPDPSGNPRAIRIADIPAISGSGASAVNMIAIPVANNAAWGGGDANRTLAVTLQTCSTSIPSTFALRITAWSNSTADTGATSWLDPENTGIAPASRLNLTTGRGSEIQKLARWGQSTESPGTAVSLVDARRFSWLVSGPRTASAPAAVPGDCHNRTCAPDFTAVAAPSAFIANTWASTVPSITYSAATFAVNNLSGGDDWGSAAKLNANGSATGNGIVSATATTMVPVPANATTASTLASTDGNLMQWVVIQWSGTTPPSDLIAEIVLL